MSQHDDHDPADLAGKHARTWTPETSKRVDEEMRELGATQGTESATEHADKSKPPEGKPSKPA